MKCLLVATTLLIASVTAFPQSTSGSFYDYMCAGVLTGVRQHPDNCFQYIKCDQGSKPTLQVNRYSELCDHFRAEVESCPQSHIFSKESIVCVVGNPTTCQEGAVVESEVEPEVSCAEGYLGRMACPGECDKYYDCATGRAQLELCFEGYVYSERFRTCLPGYQDLDGSCKLYSGL
ncbi:uncharacterized protein LOC120414970 [Culex pipiens pallens]|uniref:uncharacterized protein LOC120414970 n=1 Tax=Culex pipiens pallens TaxID=42434 RepID=UPI0022AA39ED|nr:uncharacterized protein LOC120414970 [Culex pipiens pallens]